MKDPQCDDIRDPYLKIRTITLFLGNKNVAIEHQIPSAVARLHELQSKIAAYGFEIQTVRIATRLLKQLQTVEEALEMAPRIECIAHAHGLSFLSLGAPHPTLATALLSRPGAISSLASSLTHTSFSIAWQYQPPHAWGAEEARGLAREILSMALVTNDDANFRFGVTFNCEPTTGRAIPYFPAAEAPSSVSEEDLYAFGMENSHLLYVAAQKAKENKEADVLVAFKQAIVDVFGARLQHIQHCVLSHLTPEQYGGIDTSIAPSLDRPSITEAYESLDLIQGSFGDAGTLSITEAITESIKSLPVKQTGYCGVMLPVCEDVGLSQAVSKGKLTISTLVQLASVCGVGIDTVPISCNANEYSVAALLLDVAALSKRCKGKPLSVRLLPVGGGAQPGDKTTFNSPYLCDCIVMHV